MVFIFLLPNHNNKHWFNNDKLDKDDNDNDKDDDDVVDDDNNYNYDEHYCTNLIMTTTVPRI